MKSSEGKRTERVEGREPTTEKEIGKEFERLTMSWMPALYNFARRWSGGPEDAGDLVQEAYLRAFRTYRNFTPGSNIRAWLFTILRSVMVNRFKWRKRQPTLVDWTGLEERFEETVNSLSPDWDRDLEESTDLDWTGEAVKAALERLPETHRLAVELVDLQGCTYEEASQISDCPVGTLRSRLYRARKALFVELQDYAAERGYLRNSR